MINQSSLLNNSSAGKDDLIYACGESIACLGDVLLAHCHPLPIHRFLQLLHIGMGLFAGQTLDVGPEAVVLDFRYWLETFTIELG